MTETISGRTALGLLAVCNPLKNKVKKIDKKHVILRILRACY